MKALEFLQKYKAMDFYYQMSDDMGKHQKGRGVDDELARTFQEMSDEEKKTVALELHNDVGMYVGPILILTEVKNYLKESN